MKCFQMGKGFKNNLKAKFVRVARTCRKSLNFPYSKLNFFFFLHILSHLFIYLLTLFNIDYKTLAAYALIKIDYPPLAHKKRNKNVNKSVKEDNKQDVYTVLSNKPSLLNVHFTYCTWTLPTLPFFNFLFKNVETRRIFRFFRYQVPYLRSSILDVNFLKN